ncbi:MAG: ferritin-like domain-containing protein [Candidatus Fervidibacter sp.]|uniref:ferritin-like domain-containing protein n=1 Tax=Candidatus Fervidibacter sp. TaxID=3100871 RepID=UPI00404985C6
MASERLKDLLNQAIARELQVSIQYMWQHVVAKGLFSPAVRDIFKKTAIVEMKHAEAIAERLDYLGGKPTTQPAPITVGETLEEMIRIDLKAEEEAIALYRQIIEQATSEGDYVTEDLFRSILADEEEHHNEFQALLGQ